MDVTSVLVAISAALVAIYALKQTRDFRIFVYRMKIIIKNREFFKKIPVPPGMFLIGNAFDFASATEILPKAAEHLKNYGPTIRLDMGPFEKGILTEDYKFVEFILKSNTILSKSENYRYLQPWLGSGLLISTGDTWKKHRKLLSPAFHFEILKDFVETFESVGDVLVEKFLKLGDIPSLDVYPLIKLATLDIICETAMGSQVNAQNNENSDYPRHVKEMCRIITERPVSPLKMYPLTYQFTRDYNIQKEAQQFLHKYSNNIVMERVEMRKQDLNLGHTQQEDDEDEDRVYRRKKLALLDLVLEASTSSNLLSYQEVRQEVDTFMFAGHDTTASAISFTLFCLANHSEVQAKALEEQESIFGKDSHSEVTHGDLMNMKYLESVIKETLRLYPSVPIIGRSTTEDEEFDGTIIPSGVNLGIFIFGLHRNPKFFHDPERFNPDRFLDNTEMLPFAYIPFSAGPRNCIGQKFAMLVMKSVVSKVLRNFELLPSTPKYELLLAFETILKSSNGLKVGLKRRSCD